MKVGASILLILLAVSVQAQDSNKFLELDLEQLLQVTVSGSTLRDQSLKTVPASVTVYTRQQLDLLGLDYLHELINLVPGFQTVRNADNPFSYTYSARGRREAARARELMLLVDGREFSDPRGTGADTAISLYPLAHVERVEIIRGPGSALYGSGAMAGVINIVSRRASKQLQLAVGGDERRRVDLHSSFQQGEWRGDIFMHAYEDGGQDYHLASGEFTRDPRAERVLDGALEYRNSRVNFFHSRLRGDDFYVLEKNRNDFNRYLQAFDHLRIEHKLQLGDTWKMVMSGNYLEARQEFDGLLLPEGALLGASQPPSSEAFLVKALLAAKSYRASIANDLTLSPAASLQFGVDWRNERSTDEHVLANYDLEQFARGQFPIRYSSQFNLKTDVGLLESRSVAAAYGQLLYSFAPGTELTLGARYDAYEDEDTRTSPRFALVHQLNTHHILKLLYGEAFRAPVTTETGLINNPVILGNPGLESESVKTWEVLWMATWDKLSLRSTLYHNQFINPIVSALQGNTRTFINASNTHYFGGGIGFDWQLNGHWLLRFNHSAMHDLPDTAFAEADRIIQLGLIYDWRSWSWSGFAVHHNERQYQAAVNQSGAVALAELNDYWLANSQLRYQLSPDASVFFAVKNLLDETYATPAQGVGIVAGVPNRGREWSLGVDWHW